MKKKIKAKTLKGEKLVIFLIMLTICLTPLLHVITASNLSQTNIEVEKLKSNIEYQQNINDSLNMKINELASLDKIRDVAKENGLSYNNDNIKVVD